MKVVGVAIGWPFHNHLSQQSPSSSVGEHSSPLPEPKQCGDRFAIPDLAGHNHIDGFAQRNELTVNSLVWLRLGFPRTEIFGQKHGHGFVHKARAGIKEECFVPRPGAVSGLLQQLTFSGGEGLLLGIDSTRRNLPEIIIRSIAILALQQDARLTSPGINCQNNDRTRMPYHVAHCPNAIRLQHLIGRDMEDLSGKGLFRGENLDAVRVVPPMFGFAGSGSCSFALAHDRPI